MRQRTHPRAHLDVRQHGAVEQRIAAMDAELDALFEPMDALTTAERTAVTYQLDTFTRRLGAVMNHFVAALAQVPIDELGEPSLAAALSTLLRISKADATRRINEAADLAPRSALTGEPLQPLLTHTAAAQRRGQIGPST